MVRSFPSLCVKEPQAAHLVWPPPGFPVLLSFGCVIEKKKSYCLLLNLVVCEANIIL